MERKELGKIEKVKFGKEGYDNVMLGLSLTFSGQGWGVSTFLGAWDYSFIKDPKEGSYRWTEEERTKSMIDMLNRVSDTLSKAKVDSIVELEGIPVEVTFENSLLKDWRILEEVL